MKVKKIWEFLKKNFEMFEIRIDYFLKKVDNVIKIFEKDIIDYFEIGFKFLEGMDEKEFRRQF